MKVWGQADVTLSVPILNGGGSFTSPLTLAQPLPATEIRKIERYLHLDYQKWDTQIGDIPILSRQPLVMRHHEWSRLSRLAEQLAAETIRAELLLLDRYRTRTLSAVREIGVPKPIWEILRNKTQTPGVRVMRFDFHPTRSGWRVSEVNSDVPGGWREATTLPDLYRPLYPQFACPEFPLTAWGDAVETIWSQDYIALLSAPGYLEDEQVARTFMGELRRREIPCAMIHSPYALDWRKGKGCTLRRTGERISAVIRFYQAEWLCRLPSRTGWEQLLATPEIPVVNPTISALSESKRFPLAFPARAECPTWNSLVPECRDPRDVKSNDWDRWVLKGCYSNTGDHVYLCDDLTASERMGLIREAQRMPHQWVAQERFETIAADSDRGPVYPCVGVFVVNGRAAGAYVRRSRAQITGSSAMETPLLLN